MKLHGHYQLHSKQGTASLSTAHRRFRQHCLLLGIRPTSSPEHHQPLCSESTDSALLFIETWQYWLPLLSPCQWFWRTDYFFSPLRVFSLFLSLFSSCFQEGVLFLQDPNAPHSPPFFLSVFSAWKWLPTLFIFSPLSSPLALHNRQHLCLRFCRLLLHSSDQFPRCSKWSGASLAALQGGDKISVSMPFQHLNSSHPWSNF